MSAHKVFMARFMVMGLFVGSILSTGTLAAEERMHPTPFSMDLYGSIPGAAVGDLLTVYDADGVLCGKFTIQKDGMYGFLPVYADDPESPEDEGAEPGDALTVALNGRVIASPAHRPIYWTGDGNRERVDF